MINEVMMDLIKKSFLKIGGGEELHSFLQKIVVEVREDLKQQVHAD
jgi:hypothetical protein